MGPQVRDHVGAVSWSKNRAAIGESVSLSVLLKDVPEGSEVTFLICAYNGLPSQLDRTSHQTEKIKITAQTRQGAATVEWVVALNPDCRFYAGLPTYRFQAKWGKEISLFSPVLTVGDVQAVEWIDPHLNAPRASGDDTTQAYFKDNDSITVRVCSDGLDGFRVNFLVLSRNSLRLNSDWIPVVVYNNVIFEEGEATVAFRIPESSYEHFAFGCFRCEIQLVYGDLRFAPEAFRSGLARHYATRLGIWGIFSFGPYFPNNVIIEIAKAVNGLAVRNFDGRMAKIIAGQIPEHEEDFRVFGYCRGAISMMRLCRELDDRSVKVALAIGIDHLTKAKIEVIPTNVHAIVCFFQRNGGRTRPLRTRAKTCEYRSADGANERVLNVNLSKIDGVAIFHEDVPEYILKYRDVVAWLQYPRPLLDAAIANINDDIASSDGRHNAQ